MMVCTGLMEFLPAAATAIQTSSAYPHHANCG
jgi:hypothetical protein